MSINCNGVKMRRFLTFSFSIDSQKNAEKIYLSLKIGTDVDRMILLSLLVALYLRDE